MSTATTTTPRRMLRAPQAAEYLGISASSLAKMRCYGGGPAFTRVATRTIAYDVRALDEYLDSRPTLTSTSDPGSTGGAEDR